jgi:predicted secreted protein
MAEVEVGSGDVSVTVGDTVVVRLPEMTTGHVWSVSELGDGLVLLGDRYESTGESAPGGGADLVFELRADRTGDWAVGLRLAREWESQPLDERRITVRAG